MALIVQCETCPILLAPNQVQRQEWAVVGWDEDFGSNEVEVAYCYACTWLQDREQVLAEVERTIAALDVEQGRTHDNLWRLSHEALMWLYMLDELLKAHVLKPEYQRRKREEAPALLGLTWVRGAANHRRLFDFHDATTTVWIGEWAGKEVHAIAAAWRSYPVCLDSYKVPWTHYQSFVAGRPIMDPLIEARDFVRHLGEAFWFPDGSDRQSPE